ncbi:MAG: serine protease [Lachnospiraceae bacterium]|nr:serine protease [Lachnospiraceae bacterium]
MKNEQVKRISQAVALFIFVGIVFLSALFWRTGEQETEQAEEKESAFLFSEVLGSCVRIQAEGHHGSGSIYEITEDEIIVVTNRHVLQYWGENSYVTFSNGAVGDGEVMAVSDQADAGFLSVRTEFLTQEELKGLHAVNKSERELVRSDVLYMVDLASDVWHPEVYQGQVLEPLKFLDEFGMEMLYGESLFKPGMSGCGVFDEKGDYVGMLTAGTEQNEIAAVPVEVIEFE